MRKMRGSFIAIVILLITCGAGCSSAKRSKQLSALDSAYDSGIITKDEYEVKKAALESEAGALAALDSALEAGVLTRDEYQVRKARLDANIITLAALEKARRAGILTNDEYRNKKTALLASDALIRPMPAALGHDVPAPATATYRKDLANGATRREQAQDGLKRIDNPGGGQIVYGRLAGQSSLQGALATVLRNIHSHFGGRPQLGRFFQPRGDNSLATSFTLTATNEGGKRMAGWVIVYTLNGNSPAVAAIYDDADRFGATAGVLLKKLNEAWTRDSPKRPSSAQPRVVPAHASVAEPLHQTTFPDRSGTIGLPSGWQLTSGTGGGTAYASGPHGELVYLGLILQQIYDLRHKGAQGMIQYLTKGNRPYFLSPYGGDLVSAYISVAQQGRQRKHLPLATYNVTSVRKLAPIPGEKDVVLVVGEVDQHDGKGPLVFSARLGELGQDMYGAWAMTVSGSAIPKELQSAEAPTMAAIVSSYRQNGAVIQEQTRVVVDNIKKIGEANQAQAKNIQERNDIHNAAVEAQWDDQAKYNKAFENYQLDQSVVEHKDTGAHGTLDYPAADALLRDPEHYRLVPTPEFIKGLDY